MSLVTISLDDVVNQARAWLLGARRFQRRKTYQQALRLHRLLKDPKGKAYLVALLDVSFRAKRGARVLDQIRYLTCRIGLPDAFSVWEKGLFRLALLIGRLVPNVVMRIIQWQLVWETRGLIMQLKGNRLASHIQKRTRFGFQVNVNIIGEDVSGEADALRELADYQVLLADPSVTYMSLKLSAIYSRLAPLGFDDAVVMLAQRLTVLVEQAMSFSPHKFLNLDMESYKDLRLTIAVFKRVLSQPHCMGYSAGIVIQTYLPDALDMVQDLVVWAKQRFENGGAPIKIRLVKGANLQMEQVMAGLNNWDSPVYRSKEEVDANLKRVLWYMVQEDRMTYVRVGLGSHNVLDMAYAWLLVQQQGLQDYFTFEMIEGMSNDMAYFLQSYVHQTLLYTPVVRPNNFYYALAYLFRRLDENSGDKHYLNYAFELSSNASDWEYLADLFSHSLDWMDTLKTGPIRVQNRLEELPVVSSHERFSNADNTDFYLPQNLAWALRIRDQWQSASLVKPVQATVADVDRVLATAVSDPARWRDRLWEERRDVIFKVADQFRRHRGDLIGVAALETGKLFQETDVEVSEAIDFADYYAHCLDELHRMDGVTYCAKGVVLIIAPWNFPVAIPIGGALAALAAGNTVILKPAPQSSATAAQMLSYCWAVGIPESALQLLCSDDPAVLKALTSSSAINHIVFTGSTETAQVIKASNPDVALSAETGGKNAIIVSELCDLDLAVKHSIQSAFGHAGQKCSACSILLVHASHYDDPEFMRKLKDAAESLIVGMPWELDSEMGPLVDLPSDKLKKGMVLADGETWLVAPQVGNMDNPRLLRPGIKIGVRPDSYGFRTELFGPILSVVRVESLDEAIDWVNELPYGLTSGLMSLDLREHQIWMSRIQAGNLYINRGITGAVVQRQPFGGMKLSGFGVGIKAGGPNYVMQFVSPRFSQEKSPDAVVAQYQHSFDRYYRDERDVSQLYGEYNGLRYIPNNRIVLRVMPEDRESDILLVLAALVITGNRRVVSCDLGVSAAIRAWIAETVDQFDVESETDLIRRLGSIERLRMVSAPGDALKTAVAHVHTTLISHLPYSHGRFELIYYLNEQSICIEKHRYGNMSLAEYS